MARPTHNPTAATKRRVSVCAGGGMRQEDIANLLGISIPTLRKHYEKELSSGALLQRAQVLEKLLSSAKKGSTSAARLYLANSPDFALAPVAEERPATPKGKKEQAQADAVTAAEGTEWGDLLPAGVTPIRKAS